MRSAATRLAALLSLTVLVSGCDLVPFDEDAAVGARRADDFTEVTSFEITDWSVSMDGSLVRPQGFLPVARGSSSGYLIAGEEDEIRIVPVIGGSRVGRVESLPLSDRTGAFRWTARVVPVDPEFDPEGFAPLVVITMPDDDPEAWILFRESGTTGSFSLARVNIEGLVEQFGIPNDVTVLGVQLMTNGYAGEIQVLARNNDTLALGEHRITVSGTGLAAWSEQFGADDPVQLAPLDPLFDPPASGFVSGGNTFPVPQQSDGETISRISFGNVPTATGTRRGYLSYGDGVYSGAPLRTLTWDTDGAVGPILVNDWAESIQSVSSAGIIRNRPAGKIAMIDTRAAEGSQRTVKDMGTLWYAGEYPVGEEGDTADIYSAVGLSKNAFGNHVLSVTVYRD
jgi:hypothetical protein